jgi:hypothetical protein
VAPTGQCGFNIKPVAMPTHSRHPQHFPSSSVTLKTLKVVLTIVGDLFSNAMNQEQGNIEIVKYYSPSSFEALFPSGYNEFRTKVMKVIPS